jgi:phenylacetic acid degradation operon negative regulatory protein
VAKTKISAREAPESSWLRPQSVVFTLLAEHVLGKRWAVFSGSFIDVLGRVGISEQATRSTLTRMASRGLFERKRQGRKIYFAMTPRCVAILQDGWRRIWEVGAVNHVESGDWTLLAFSLPEAWSRERHDLRSRLTWAGFGPLQNGMWLAPARVDITPIVKELALAGHVWAFQARPARPSDPASVIRATFDLDALEARYRAFIAYWERHAADQPDALVLTLRLSTQWLRIIRDDPRVPVELLPDAWPAISAQQLFRSLHSAERPRAEALARELLETIEI